MLNGAFVENRELFTRAEISNFLQHIRNSIGWVMSLSPRSAGPRRYIRQVGCVVVGVDSELRGGPGIIKGRRCDCPSVTTSAPFTPAVLTHPSVGCHSPVCDQPRWLKFRERFSGPGQWYRQ